MDNKQFNDMIVEWSSRRMVSQGYSKTVDEARAWLESRREKPMFSPAKLVLPSVVL